MQQAGCVSREWARQKIPIYVSWLWGDKRRGQLGEADNITKQSWGDNKESPIFSLFIHSIISLTNNFNLGRCQLPSCLSALPTGIKGSKCFHIICIYLCVHTESARLQIRVVIIIIIYVLYSICVGWFMVAWSFKIQNSEHTACIKYIIYDPNHPGPIRQQTCFS